MEIKTLLIWTVGSILWGIAMKLSDKGWIKIMFGFSLGMLLSIILLYILL